MSTIMRHSKRTLEGLQGASDDADGLRGDSSDVTGFFLKSKMASDNSLDMKRKLLTILDIHMRH